jgi:hypothetical protein
VRSFSDAIKDLGSFLQGLELPDEWAHFFFLRFNLPGFLQDFIGLPVAQTVNFLSRREDFSSCL